MRHVARIARNIVENIYFDSKIFQTFFEHDCTVLSGELSDYDTAHIEAFSPEFINQAEYIAVVGDSKIPAHFVLLDSVRADGDDNLSLICKLHQHTQFAVRSEAGRTLEA